MRTAALHKALLEAPVPDDTLIALLVLALSGTNIRIDGPNGGYSGDRRALAATLIEGQFLTAGGDLVRQTARRTLTEVLSCRQDISNSGVVAIVAGETIAADSYLPNMATEDMLSCLSKPAVERVAGELGVMPFQRGKDTRAAVIVKVGEGRFILSQARFNPDAADIAALAATRGPFASADGECSCRSAQMILFSVSLEHCPPFEA
jgi:ParB family chromosome partitioning protein